MATNRSYKIMCYVDDTSLELSQEMRAALPLVTFAIEEADKKGDSSAILDKYASLAKNMIKQVEAKNEHGSYCYSIDICLAAICDMFLVMYRDLNLDQLTNLGKMYIELTKKYQGQLKPLTHEQIDYFYYVEAKTTEILQDYEPEKAKDSSRLMGFVNDLLWIRIQSVPTRVKEEHPEQMLEGLSKYWDIVCVKPAAFIMLSAILMIQANEDSLDYRAGLVYFLQHFIEVYEQHKDESAVKPASGVEIVCN